MAKKKAKATPAATIEELLRVGEGFRLADVDCESTPGFDGGKTKGKEALAEHAAELGDWQEKLHAESRGRWEAVSSPGRAGDGHLRQGRHHAPRRQPDRPGGNPGDGLQGPDRRGAEARLPLADPQRPARPGKLGVFDRSHYEDVLIVRVHDLVPKTEWLKRYSQINAFEREVIASGTRIIKVMTHISKDEQKARLRERLERPDKHYKYNPGDVDERMHWDDYMEAYQVALTRTSTKAAPWYVVPANKKWYARYAVQQLLLDALTEMAPTWPVMDFDVAAELARLDAS